MIRLPVVMALLPLMLGPSRAGAQGDPWVRHVRHQLERATERFQREGFAALDFRTGSLNLGESDTLTLTLQAGTTYAVIGVCDNDCTSLQLVLYNDAGTYEVAAERAISETPSIRMTPRETARYRLKVVMAGCGISPCSYGIGALQR